MAGGSSNSYLWQVEETRTIFVAGTEEPPITTVSYESFFSADSAKQHLRRVVAWMVEQKADEKDAALEKIDQWDGESDLSVYSLPYESVTATRIVTHCRGKGI